MGTLSSQSKPTINHFSHPHPLHLTNHNPTLTLAPSSCSGCKLPLSHGLTYTCKLCNYHLHIECSEMPQKIKHPFDQSHVFSLFATPVYPDGLFRCDACGENGSGFSYHCSDCGTDLHILCASKPLSITHHLHHHHNLNLVFSPPYFNKSFSCDVCKGIGGSHWLYRCGPCGFDAHLSCGTSKAIPAQSPPTAQIHQYQQAIGVPVHVVQPPPQMPAHLQQFVAEYRAPGGIPAPGSPHVNHQPFNFMNHVNTGGIPNSPIANGAFRMNQGTHNFYPGAPQVASQQTFHGQMPGRTIDNDAVLQLLLQLLRDNSGGGGGGGGGNVNAQLLQAILSANGSSGSGNGGGGNNQLLQGMMGGGGGGGIGGGFDVSSLLGGNFDLSSLLGGNFNISSLLGLMGGFGFI